MAKNRNLIEIADKTILLVISIFFILAALVVIYFSFANNYLSVKYLVLDEEGILKTQSKILDSTYELHQLVKGNISAHEKIKIISSLSDKSYKGDVFSTIALSQYKIHQLTKRFHIPDKEDDPKNWIKARGIVVDIIDRIDLYEKNKGELYFYLLETKLLNPSEELIFKSKLNEYDKKAGGRKFHINKVKDTIAGYALKRAASLLALSKY